MTIPTQTVIGKGIPNPLTAEDLLKILSDLILFDSSKILYQIPPMEWWIKRINHVEGFTFDFFHM